MIEAKPFSALPARMERMGLMLEPNDDPNEAEGVLNPASARTRSGELMLYPRDVGPGNTSRVGRVLVHESGDEITCERQGYALEPSAEYEVNGGHGFGCEDPRVTFIPALDTYVMAYTAYGSRGPRIAFALSHDAKQWERLGLVEFPASMEAGDDKDAAFFPEPVLSPSGMRSLAFYHRPMLPGVAHDAQSAMAAIMAMPACERESISIAYVSLEDVERDRKNLLRVRESKQVMCPDATWGRVKLGGGTPPVRIDEGWMSLYHGVDAIEVHPGLYKMSYSAGLVVHAYDRPDHILYRSQTPIFSPETEDERIGTVNNVVFPTAIDVRADLGPRTFDVFYGMADRKIGRARLYLGPSSNDTREENAA